MERKLFQPHYDREFKTKIVEEYLATGCTKMSLIRKYNIQFKSAVQTWIRVLGYSDPYGPSQTFKFGEIIFFPFILIKVYKCVNLFQDETHRIKQIQGLVVIELFSSRHIHAYAISVFAGGIASILRVLCLLQVISIQASHSGMCNHKDAFADSPGVPLQRPRNQTQEPLLLQ